MPITSSNSDLRLDFTMPQQTSAEVLTPAAKQSRRRFIGHTGLAVAGGAFGASLLSRSLTAQTLTDVDVLNFALNLEYLEAELYSRAVFGTGLDEADVTGTGTLGEVIVKPGSTQVPFATESIRQFAIELTANEVAHVRFIRRLITQLGGTPIARPTIDLRDSFVKAATLAGLISPGGPPAACPAGQPATPRPADFFVPTADCQAWVPNNHPLAPKASAPTTFDPFADEISFLLAGFMSEDVGVTAYKGSSRLLTNRDVIEAAAGLLALEAYHSSLIRTVLFERGVIEPTQKISDLRDAADGPDDRDQPIVLGGNANIAPTDENALPFSRTPEQVLNIVYLGGEAANFGFFPNRVNGPIQ
jgi:Ferritin-like domain